MKAKTLFLIAISIAVLAFSTGSYQSAESSEINTCVDGTKYKNPCADLYIVWPDPPGLTLPYTYVDDLCSGYRCLRGNEINPACYTLSDCKEACGNGECVNIGQRRCVCINKLDNVSVGSISPYYFLSDTCGQYRCLTQNNISAACYTREECLAVCLHLDCVNMPELLRQFPAFCATIGQCETFGYKCSDNCGLINPADLSCSTGVCCKENVICGDVNKDYVVNESDINFLVDYIFRGGARPEYMVTANVNGDWRIDIADLIYLGNHVVKKDNSTLVCRGCTGTAKGCALYSANATACLNAGCSYENYYKECYGLPKNCWGFKSESACTFYGCEWIGG